jgi:hypothetical protein
MTYRFRVATDVPPGNHRVFVHVVDADEELLWTDDHESEPPVGQWKAGQTVEYNRTMFAPIERYTGPVKVLIGVYDVSTKQRLRLSNTERRDQDKSYQVAEFELLPQTENVYLIFKDGWHSAEFAPDNPKIEWQWTRKAATLAFRNPRRESTLYLQLDNPSRAASAATEVEVRVGDQLIATVPVGPDDSAVRKITLTTAQLGPADMTELRLVANRTFVPALESGAKTVDTRELGVRVFHAFVQPGS